MKASVPILISMVLAIGGVLIAPVSVTPQGLHTPEATTTQDYDYRSLAVASILTSAQEASKLPNIEDRVSLVIAAVKLLPASHRDEAVSLIKSSLQDLQEFKPERTNIGRFTLNRLHNELLAVYAQLDPERALAPANQGVQEEIAVGDRNKFLRAGEKWSAGILARRAPPDQTANLAISIVDTNPEQALALVIQSVKDGIVSGSINALCEKLAQNPNRDFLDRLQLAVAESLASTTTMDSFSWGYAVGLLNDDRMNYKAKRGLIPPSPAKVALTLMATALMAEDNPQRSFETLATAAKFAKSSKDLVEQQAGGVRALRLEVSIGKLSLIPGSEPKSLAEVRIDPRVALLARSDWFRTQYLANSFPESALRLMLKLQFAGGVLSDSAKQTKSSQKRPSKG